MIFDFSYTAFTMSIQYETRFAIFCWLNTSGSYSGLSLVIRQKGESQNVCFKKTTRQIFRKTNIFYPLIRTSSYVCVSGGKKCLFFRKFGYQWVKDVFQKICLSGGKNIRFSENLTGFVFLKHPFWDSPFCLITDDFISVHCHPLINLKIKIHLLCTTN